jgi:hypothetical protein
MAVKKKMVVTLPSQTGKLIAYCNTLSEQEYEVFVCTKRKTRSLPQNKYYWGCVLAIISKEVGIDPEDLHEYFKDKYSFRTEFYLREDYVYSKKSQLLKNELLGGIRDLPISTKMMSTKDFGEYLDKIVRWANEKDMRIPQPNEIPEDLLINILNNSL